MRVSALVTTFNHAPYIEFALDSLLAQTHPEVEIIVVDDGSTDGTFERAAGYEKQGVRLLRSTGDGPSRAMNMAISNATGGIFILQSGDDISAPNRAIQQSALLSSADLTFAEPFLIGGDGALLRDSAFPAFIRQLSMPNSELLFRSLFLDGNFICASSVALTRSAWERIGEFDNGLLQLQDYDYWLRALCRGCNFAITGEHVAFYRWHSTNLSTQTNDVRTQREIAFILRRLVETAPEPFLAATHYGCPPTLKAQPMPRKALEALICLRHGSKFVKQVGVDIILNNMGSSEFEEIFGSLGFSRRDLFHAMLAN